MCLRTHFHHHVKSVKALVYKFIMFISTPNDRKCTGGINFLQLSFEIDLAGLFPLNMIHTQLLSFLQLKFGKLDK